MVSQEKPEVELGLERGKRLLGCLTVCYKKSRGEIATIGRMKGNKDIAITRHLSKNPEAPVDDQSDKYSRSRT